MKRRGNWFGKRVEWKWYGGVGKMDVKERFGSIYLCI